MPTLLLLVASGPSLERFHAHHAPKRCVAGLPFCVRLCAGDEVSQRLRSMAWCAPGGFLRSGAMPWAASGGHGLPWVGNVSN